MCVGNIYLSLYTRARVYLYLFSVSVFQRMILICSNFLFTGAYKFRKEPMEGYVSSLEAIARCIEILEPRSTAPGYLLKAFHLLVNFQLAYIHEALKSVSLTEEKKATE